MLYNIAMANTLEVDIKKKNENTTIVMPRGRIDSESYVILDTQLQSVVEEHPKKVLIDMKGCEYVSSAGIRVFFDFRKHLQERRAAVSFFNMHPHIQKVFEIVKALPLECIFSNMEEADAYLERMMKEG